MKHLLCVMALALGLVGQASCLSLPARQDAWPTIQVAQVAVGTGQDGRPALPGTEDLIKDKSQEKILDDMRKPGPVDVPTKPAPKPKPTKPPEPPKPQARGMLA